VDKLSRLFFVICLLIGMTACVGTVETDRKGEVVAEWIDELGNICPTINASEDAQISFSTVNGTLATTNYGNAATMLVGKQNGGTTAHRSLFKFPTGSIPNDAVVASATVSLNRIAASGAGTLSFYRATAAWSEGTVTWNTYTGGTGVLLSTIAGPVGAGTTLFDATSTAQGWIDGSITNNGFLMDGSSYLARHATSEAPSGVTKPTVTVCYSSCLDGVLNGTETDVDCGGGTCAGCDASEICAGDADCASPLLCKSGVCSTPTCDDTTSSCGNDLDPGSCIYCAITGACAGEYSACLNSTSCVTDYAGCNSLCTNVVCDDLCRAQFPAGAALFDALVVCVMDEQCPLACPSQ
jgi:hypothetical protein